MTEYRRYQGKSYMVWSGETKMGGYEEQMLTKNKIQGLLPTRMVGFADGTQFWFDISGRQSLTDQASMRPLGCEFLRRILESLTETVEHCGEYLLPDEGICLDAEYIFADGESVAFCYRPFAKEDFTQALCSFMEYYLSHMEHGDREGTQRCYDVYEKCRQGNVRLEDLLQIVISGEKDQPVAQNAAAPEEVNVDSLQTITKKARTNKKKILFPNIQMRSLGFGKQNKPPREAFVFEPEDERQKMANPTVFLGSETEEILGELKYEGEENGVNLTISKPVFLIGSKEDEVDGYICDDTVSRIHARVTREEGGFYLEDMNSTNGTSRNGEALNYKEKVLLEKNDKIVFAKVKFRFV